MAFANGTIWHGWSTGATTNGGGFDPTNAGFLTDLAVDTNTGNTNSPVVSSASYNFVAGDVAAWVFVQSGTGWTPGWYQIASVASNKATLTATIGTAVLYGTVITDRNYHRPSGLNTVAGCSGASSTGGVWSIDYSQQTGSALSYTDIVIDGTTNTDGTSAAHPFGKQQLGNIWNVTAGTGFTVQRVQLTSIPSGVVGRFDKSLGTLSSTGGTAAMGGAIGSTSVITALTQALVAGNKVYLKGTYTVTATTTVTASVKGDTTNGRIVFEGFSSYPGDGGRVTITSATNSIIKLTFNDNDYTEWRNFSITDTAGTRGSATTFVTSASAPIYFVNWVVDGCLSFNSGVAAGSNLFFEACEIKNCTSATVVVNLNSGGRHALWGCDIHDNSGAAFLGGAFGAGLILELFDCIIDTNLRGFDGNSSGSVQYSLRLHRTTFVDNTNEAIKISTTTSTTSTIEVFDCVFYGNTYGINNTNAQQLFDANLMMFRNNAFGNQGTAPYTGISGGTFVGEITLTADPFTNRAARDFSPNNTAGGGALLRAAAFPTTYPSGTTTSYRDVGPVQHQDSGGGGASSRRDMRGGFIN